MTQVSATFVTNRTYAITFPEAKQGGIKFVSANEFAPKSSFREGFVALLNHQV